MYIYIYIYMYIYIYIYIKIQVQYHSRCKEPAEDWSVFSAGTFSL